MHQLTNTRRSLGITFPAKNRAEIVLWAPQARHAAIKVYGHPTALPLKSEELGYWCAETDDIRPGDLYTFILDGETERPDPASLSQPQGVHGPSEAVNTAHFDWTDQDWPNHPLEDYVLYELHTGTFTSEGTFAAIEEKLDYLKSLGVTAIEIMPIAQFPETRNWGYDGVFPFAAQNSYGGVEGLHHLVNACHAKGLAVVLDVVYNHFGPEGNYTNDYGPYLTGKYCTPWGKAINFDDAWCDGVRRFFTENALMWLRDFHIDALRLDAVHAIKDFSPKHILEEIREQVDLLMENTGRRHYLIIESDLNDPRFISPPSEHGYGMDAQWMDEFHHALRVTVGEARKGYYADFTGINHLAKSYKDAYVYDGQYSVTRERYFGSSVENRPGQQFIVFSQNHDQIGNRMLGERSSQLYSFNILKLMAGAVMVSPYLPLLFMGEEWAEPNPFLYFVSHTETELVEAVRQGRKEEFSEFHAEGDVPDPSAEATFQQSKLQWDLLTEEPHQTLVQYYQTLIALRKQHPALRHLNRANLDVSVLEKQQTILLHRWHQDQHVLCCLNFAKEPQSVQLPAFREHWHKLLDSSEPEWQPPVLPGPAFREPAPDEVPDAGTLTVQPESIVIYGNA
ncbi:malto-oligosyltrehalose trehalohydrolase [Larkinella knui]|uniref:Malto-oligosyltrehalose trehalohydrolase n=1 Tax=Larkinella knui TaxID=2025310 RepID=A0A3P1CYM7_9BACT|nr:malto-oligosyltrehalose trehalohydrolase [Larkinella knui]RRB18096.1 malto-oligosyltrehalose trehalohydrolase [Larkinella knui]